jgi:ribosomal protein L19
MRNVVAGEPVEQTFILESPMINQVDIIGKTKGSSKAKKYYIRTRTKSESKI